MPTIVEGPILSRINFSRMWNKQTNSENHVQMRFLSKFQLIFGFKKCLSYEEMYMVKMPASQSVSQSFIHCLLLIVFHGNNLSKGNNRAFISVCISLSPCVCVFLSRRNSLKGYSLYRSQKKSKANTCILYALHSDDRREKKSTHTCNKRCIVKRIQNFKIIFKWQWSRITKNDNGNAFYVTYRSSRIAPGSICFHSTLKVCGFYVRFIQILSQKSSAIVVDRL